MADNEENKDSVVISAAKTTSGGFFGGITGTVVGAALSAVAGAIIGAVASGGYNYFVKDANPFTGVTPTESATVTENARINAANLAEVAIDPNHVNVDGLYTTPQRIGINMGAAAAVGSGIFATIGGMFGSITGAIGGMFTGWRNANPPKDGLEAEQAKQMEFAKGVAQGVTMAKIEDMELQAASTSWTERVGGVRKDPNMLFQDQIAQQKLALKTIEPMGTA